jgi:site-specific recombinase XerD
MSVTFNEQAKFFLESSQNRKRNPVKIATVTAWQCSLKKWLIPHFQDALLGTVANSSVRTLVEKMYRHGLSASTIVTYVNLVKLIVASALTEEGEPQYPRKWNSNFIDLPTVSNQRQPCFSREQMEAIVLNSTGQVRMLSALLAGTGLRVGEALGLEIKHISPDGRTLTVEQSAWATTIQTPKTPNAFRQIDLHSELAAMLSEHVEGRSSGLVFRNVKGKLMSQTNTLRRDFHPLLKRLGIEKQGFHGFRRFRCTWLRRNAVSEDLVKYWLGHSTKDVTDRYSKVSEDAFFRKMVSEKVGLGFAVSR